MDLKGEWAKPETDEQLYARKYSESRAPKQVEARRRSPRSPWRACTHRSPSATRKALVRPDFVAGGHHRIAVMRNLNPDQYMPVMHVRSVGEAQGLGLVNGYRGEVKPRRTPTRHHIQMYSASHNTQPVSDPFPPLSNKQFPAFYTRSPIKNMYRSYMSAKSAYKKPRF